MRYWASCRAILLSFGALLLVGLLLSPQPASANAGLQVLVQTWDPNNPDLHPANSAFDDPTFFDTKVNQAWALARGPICTQLLQDLSKPNIAGNGFSLYNTDCTMASNVAVSIVGPASVSKVTMQFVGTGNVVDATSTQPYVGSWGDPRFSVTFDMTANVTLVPLPQPKVTALSVTVSNGSISTQNTMADILKALDSFAGTGFVTQAQNSINTTKKLDPSIINNLLAGVQTPLSQASQFPYVALWHHNSRIVIDLAPQAPDQPRPGSISGAITWTKASNITISDCSKIQFTDTVQLGPAPLTFPYGSFGNTPTDTFGAHPVSSGAPADMGDHYQCQYTYSQIPLALPNSFAGSASGSTGQKGSQYMLSYLAVKPSNWSGTVNPSGSQSGLNFQILASTAMLPFHAAINQVVAGPQNPGDPLHSSQIVNPNIAVNNAKITQTQTSSALAQNAALANELVNQGTTLMKSNDLAGAAAAFNNALALKADNQVALLNLGLVHLKMGQTATGRNELQHALQVANLHGDTATAAAAQAALRGIGAAPAGTMIR